MHNPPQQNNKSYQLAIPALLIPLLVLYGCSKPDPVAESECNKVVSHVKSILKDRAPSQSEMLKQCKTASDEARGCVMAANKPMKILQCDF